MMDNVKIGLIGLVLVVSAFGVYQVSSLKGEMEKMQADFTASINSLKNSSVTNGTAANQPANVNNQKANNLPVAETKPLGPITAINFAEELHNFGTVEVESENKYAFTFTNTGSEPLTISNAKGSCGCTVPNWPKEAILPGQTGTIDVVFTPNKGQAGQEVEKIVTVTANTSPENTMVRIKANVVDK